MAKVKSGTPTAEVSDFTVAIYKGPVLPERSSPVGVMSWADWKEHNSGYYTATQFQHMAQRLLAGKNWVAFEEPGTAVLTLVAVLEGSFPARQLAELAAMKVAAAAATKH